MKVLRRACYWLATLGLLASCAGVRAAVMTTTIRVSSGAAPFTFSYVLAQQATAMTVNIRKASDDSIVRVLTTASGAIPSAALTQGPHTGDFTWDGATTAGSPAPAGDYYAQVITTGDANSGLTQLSGPVMQTDPANSAKTDGRFYYGFDTNKDPTSPYHNYAYVPAYTNGNAGQETGVYVVNADCTTNSVIFTATQTVGNYIGGAVLSDGKIVLSPQAGGANIPIINPDGTLYKNVTITNAANIYARGMRAYGTGDTAKIWFIDAGSTGSPGAGSVDYVDSTASPVVVSFIIPLASLPTSGRSLDVKADGSALWVYGRSPAWVQKWNNNAGTWTKDANFTFTNPAATPSAAVNPCARLSPDGNTLWISVNDGNTTVDADRVIQGVDPNTGVSKGAAYTLANLTLAPEEIAQTTSGNLYVVCYSSHLSGTTGDSLAIVAPPDSGSTDTTVSTKFSVISDTTLRFTSQPVVSNLTYHGCTITWDTNYACDSTVNWGSASGNYDGGTVTKDADPNPVTHHVVTLDGLEKATTYHYQVTDQETGFTPSPLTSADLTFTTHGLTISAIAVNPISDTTATVTWTTNDPATSIVNYGTQSGAEDHSASDTSLVTSHSIVISSLTPVTPYYFTVESGYTSGPPPTHTISAEQSFTTLGSIIIKTETLAADQTTATLGFTTNVTSAATIHWGASSTALTNTITVPSGTTHTAAFTGLTAGTAYYYDMDLSGSSLAGYTTPISTFTTAVAGGTGSTITQSAPADFVPALRTNVDLGSAGSLITLSKQGIPGTPISAADLPVARNYVGVATYNGYMYVIGGRNSSAAQTADVYYSSINADGSLAATWNTATNLPDVRAFMNNMCFGYNGYIYAVGGETTDGTTMTTVYYAKQNADGSLGSWLTTTPLPSERDLGSAIVVDGYVLVSGGENNAGSAQSGNWMAPIHADGTLGAWSTVYPLESTKWFQHTFANAHTLYSVGGIDTNSGMLSYTSNAFSEPNGTVSPFVSVLNDVNHSSDTMDGTHYSNAAGLLGGKIVAAAGRLSAASPHSLISMTKIGVDGLTETWQTVAADGDANAYPVSVLDNDGQAYSGRLYCAGGRQTFGVSTDPVANVVIIPMVADTADPDGATYAYSGTVESSVIDLTAPTNLKHLKVTVTGGTVDVRYRFANTDGAFSDWFTPSSVDADISGGARYFQYQLVLSGSGTSTPTVNSVALTTVAGVSTALPGDLNKDGVVDAKDVKLALQIAAGLLNANDPSVSFSNGNVVADTVIDVLDAVAIQRKINGK